MYNAALTLLLRSAFLNLRKMCFTESKRLAQPGPFCEGVQSAAESDACPLYMHGSATLYATVCHGSH